MFFLDSHNLGKEGLVNVREEPVLRIDNVLSLSEGSNRRHGQVALLEGADLIHEGDSSRPLVVLGSATCGTRCGKCARSFCRGRGDPRERGKRGPSTASGFVLVNPKV